MESVHAQQLTRFQVAANGQIVGIIRMGDNDQLMRINAGQFVLGNITQVIATFNLPESQNARALAVVERFKDRIRPGDAERTALLAQLHGILSDEERDDFGAALARRPVIKAAGTSLDGAVQIAVRR